MNKQHRPRIRTICHPHFFNIYFGFKSPQWPNILGQESMYKQHRPRLSGSTLFAIPIIFIFILCIYIIKMSLHIRTEVHAQTGHTQTCTIRHITHSHVVTSPQWPFILGQKLYTLPEWPMYWDRSVCTNSADPDLIRVCTIWHTANIYMLYLRKVKSTCSSLSVVSSRLRYAQFTLSVILRVLFKAAAMNTT